MSLTRLVFYGHPSNHRALDVLKIQAMLLCAGYIVSTGDVFCAWEDVSRFNGTDWLPVHGSNEKAIVEWITSRLGPPPEEAQ